MTLAPRVEVYTQLACRAIHGNDPVDPNATSLYFPSLPSSSDAYEYDGHNLPTKTYHDSDYDHDETAISFPSSGIVDAETLDACKGDPRVQGRAARIQACMSISVSSSLALLHSFNLGGRW